MRVRFTPEAESDYFDALGWYDAREHRLAAEFRRSVDTCISAIQANPEAFPKVHARLRRALLRRFPYGLFYLAEEKEIVVLACFHAARDPKAWRRRSP